ncbi:MAG: tetratricopeptide repeat protein [Myxococcales bacterium]|nr:MAG: tetratricopeptide repeat protein [Myxococcales bacterium]
MSQPSCEQVAQRLSEVLDGSAPAALLDHVGGCDACRDCRHEAEEAARLVAGAGRDFELPADLLEKAKARAAKPRDASPQRAEAAPSAPQAAVARSKAIARLKRWTIPALAAAAAAMILAGRGTGPGTSVDDPELVGPPWRGKVAKLLSPASKLEVCAPNGSACRIVKAGDEVPAGSQLRTDRATLAELSFTDGSTVSLDRDTSLRLSTRGRGGELLKGGVVADVQRQETSGVRFEFKGGHLDVLGTKFALRSEEDSATVHVARGEVRLSDGAGHQALVVAGEQGRVDSGGPPVTSSSASLGEALGWSEAVQTEADEEPEPRPRALGELKAQKPGEKGERAGAVRLDSHDVRIRIAGSVARTEVEEVFTNQTDDVLEGIFRFPLPPDAKIERLALEVDGRLEEGAFVDRERAAAIWRGAIVNAAPQLRPQIKEEIIWVPGPWRDPALLEWQRGGRFELRIFPIPRRGSRRVVLAYSQVVAPAGTVRHYSYPLGIDPSGNAAPLSFSIDARVTGNDPSYRVRTPGWDVSRSQEGGAQQLRFDARSFVPTGDFTLDYALPGDQAELSAWAYRDASASGDAARPYVALALRPRLPKARAHAGGRSVALVIDSSRSMFGESYRRATLLAARIARDLEPSDRVAVLACDSTCREMPGELRPAGAGLSREVRRFLENQTPEGASDVSLSVAKGFAALRGIDAPPHVVYIGDAAATVGPTRPQTLERDVRGSLPAGGRVTALGIGPESDAESLRALARGGSGMALPYLPGQPLADAALSTISALSGAALSDPRLELPEGISLVAPARLDPITSGSELVLGGRLNRDDVRGEAVLRGSVDGQPFEQRYRLEVSASSSSGNAFVPRLFAAARIADLERDGSEVSRREAVALSTEHRVASRYTSLLVLESEAMYKAFGLDNARRGPEYTADLEAEGSSSSGELALSDDESRDKAKEEASVGALQSPADLAAPRSAPKAALGRAAGASGSGDPFHMDFRSAPEPARRAPDFAPAPAASSAPQPPPASPEKKRFRDLDEGNVLAPAPSPRRMIPMRRVWERKGDVLVDRFVPKAASGEAVSAALRELAQHDVKRENLKRAFALSSVTGDLAEAARLAERWLEKEPLDPEALTALADVEARRGNRDAAIRLLGSVLDVRPGDTAAHKRLARLQRWAGHTDLACRHSVAIAEGKPGDLALVAEAVRCTRQQGSSGLADALLAAAETSARSDIERRAAAPRADDGALSGDVRVDANWSGGADLDVALLDLEGHRISWLGAATRAVISARDSTSGSRESLAVRGALPGEYVVELTRGGGAGSASGELVVTIAGATRRVPFSFDGDRKAVALLRITMQPRLVPL